MGQCAQTGVCIFAWTSGISFSSEIVGREAPRKEEGKQKAHVWHEREREKERERDRERRKRETGEREREVGRETQQERWEGYIYIFI